MTTEQVPPDSPDRCQGVGRRTGSQCSNRAVRDGKCASCLSDYTTDYVTKDWLLQQYKKAVREKLNPGSELDLLREDVLTIRTLIAARRKLITDDQSFEEHSGPLGTLLTKAEKLIRTLVELERQHDELLNKDAIVAWASNIHTIVMDKIEGRFDGWEDVGDELGELLAKSIVNASNKE